ncbi:transcriptional regulator [Cellulosimicrobium cellulans]|uniref:transcriptional regulator n=1 Tax=Cellulosimicrobium cellulans TaxID=1710 RepID=UPI000D3ACB1F|nr:transcriptional regulator [Sphaerisporangium cinnabarinum]MCR1983336.1 transcriptional regulator [Cellulosimicrobium cellulans]PTU56353.1 ArsR family transcriptional regulator [Sphaerisporangium cinnabarinum]
MSHPRKGLDALIHSPVRFSILAALANVESADFRFLADLVELSDSSLSQALTALSDAGLVEIRKEAAGRRTRTWVRISDRGLDAFRQHVRTLEQIARTGAIEPRPDPTPRGTAP